MGFGVDSRVGLAVGLGGLLAMSRQRGASTPVGPILAQQYRILCLGDSTTVGRGAGGAGTDGQGMAGARLLAWPARLSVALAALGYTSQENSMLGDASVSLPRGNTSPGVANTGAYWEYDNRVNMEAITVPSESPTMGANAWAIAATGTATDLEENWTFSGVDTFELWNARRSANGSFIGLVNDVQQGGIITQTNATASVAKDVFTATLGTNKLTMRRNAGANWFYGINAYNSAVNSLQVINAGWRGGTVGDLGITGFPGSPLPMIGVVNPHLTIISIGINDYRASGGTSAADPGGDPVVGKATFKARLLTLIQTAKATQSAAGKVILVTPTPTSTTGVAGLPRSAVLEAYSELAASESVALFDTDAAMVAAYGTSSYTGLNSLGQMYDTLHPLPGPYNALASALAPTVKTVLNI
jgi:lysophospholipase L1-like esterase